MFGFLPREVQAGLDDARLQTRKRKSRLRMQVGEAVFPILRLWDGGFALEATMTPHLRGLVDIFDGSRHLLQCLIIASTEENGELICEFKRSTAVTETAALDYWRDEGLPVGYLEGPTRR